MKPVLLNDFRAQWSRHRAEVLAAVDRVGDSGWLILGAEVSHFEETLAEFCGLAFCVGCASGLDAIEIALRAAGLQPGQKVLTTPLSAFATTLAIVRAGGEPVFVDVDETGLLDLDLCRQALEAEDDLHYLLPVHLYGQAMNLRRLAELRDRFSLHVIEDCAQAIGARSHGERVGSVGELAATSFYPTKNLGAMGDGGALLTQREEHAHAARALRDYGQTRKFEHEILGLNSRLDELHAAILGRVFLPRLSGNTQRRGEIAMRYQHDITHPELSTPARPNGSESVWHLYPLLVASDRDGFRRHLDGAGIASGVHYPDLIPDQKALQDRAAGTLLTPLPLARHFARSEVSLPIHPFLSDEDVERVINACNSWRG